MDAYMYTFLLLHSLSLSSHTCVFSSEARPWARWAVNVLFPTPPLPDRTRILCLTFAIFTFTSSIAVRYWCWRFHKSIFHCGKSCCYLDRGPWASQMHRCPDWDSLDMLTPYQHLHSEYQGNLQESKWERILNREREKISYKFKVWLSTYFQGRPVEHQSCLDLPRLELPQANMQCHV